jgi:hypothetical protein
MIKDQSRRVRTYQYAKFGQTKLTNGDEVLIIPPQNTQTR